MFNLTNNIDVENTKQRMEQYQRDNRDLIQRNKVKLVRADFSPVTTGTFSGVHTVLGPAAQTREQEELEELLLLEQQDNEKRRLELLQEEQRQLQAKKKSKQALLDELVSVLTEVLTHSEPEGPGCDSIRS